MYYPAFSAIYHSFFSWDGFTQATFVGLGNFAAMTDDATMSRRRRERAQADGVRRWSYRSLCPCSWRGSSWVCQGARARFPFACLFVIPLVLPQVVIYLIWKSSTTPTSGCSTSS